MNIEKIPFVYLYIIWFLKFYFYDGIIFLVKIEVTYFNGNHLKHKRPLKYEFNNTLTDPESLINLEGN